ncbi:hypothetical protein BJ165DRAFT_1534056 [Panaeolus papilionaceus]|nr:hypothetical protein BJ165DRAFT_1534056 [Panaeolus papilionaceus]
MPAGNRNRPSSPQRNSSSHPTPLFSIMQNSQATNPTNILRSRRQIEEDNRRKRLVQYREVRAAMVHRRIAELSRQIPDNDGFESMYRRAMTRLYPIGPPQTETPNPLTPDTNQFIEDGNPSADDTNQSTEGTPPNPSSTLQNIFAPQPRLPADTPFVLRGAAELFRPDSSPEPAPPPQTPSPSPSPEPNSSPSPTPTTSSMPDLNSPSPVLSPTPPPHFSFRPLNYEGDLDEPLPKYRKNGPFQPAVTHLKWRNRGSSTLRIIRRNRPPKVKRVYCDSDDEDMQTLLASNDPPKYSENPEYDVFMRHYVDALSKDDTNPKPGQDEDYDREMTEVVRRVSGDPAWVLAGSETFHYGTAGQGSSQSQ